MCHLHFGLNATKLAYKFKQNSTTEQAYGVLQSKNTTPIKSYTVFFSQETIQDLTKTVQYCMYVNTI